MGCHKPQNAMEIHVSMEMELMTGKFMNLAQTVNL